MDFQGKLVIVTGAASGIGAATARMFAAGGARVVAVDIDAIGVDKIVTELGDGASGYVADLSRQADVEAMMITAIERLDGLDILVNNAGIGSLAKAADLSPEEWRRVLSLDLDAVFYACRLALPHLIRRGGCIVNTASISGMAADYGFTAYNVAKAGLIGLTRVMAIDYAEHGVRVNAVSPGFTATPLVSMMPDALIGEFVSRVPMRRAGDPKEIASVIAFLASSAASYVTGQNIPVDGGMTAHTGQPDPLAYFHAMQSAAATL